VSLVIELLYQVHGWGFCAGVVVSGGRVVAAAPILVGAVRGLDFASFLEAALIRGWTVVHVS
jgi:hypothetical protein